MAAYEEGSSTCHQQLRKKPNNKFASYSLKIYKSQMANLEMITATMIPIILLKIRHLLDLQLIEIQIHLRERESSQYNNIHFSKSLKSACN